MIDFFPKRIRSLPMEIMLPCLMILEPLDFMTFIFSFFRDSKICYFLVSEYVKKLNREWTSVEKSIEENKKAMKSFLAIMFYILVNNQHCGDFTDFLDEPGTCYLSELDELCWLKVCKDVIGCYPSPWLVECLYDVNNHFTMLSNCRTHGCAVRAMNGSIIYHCIRCQINGFLYNRFNEKGSKVMETDKLLFKREINDLNDLHLVGYHDHRTMSYKAEQELVKTHGQAEYITLFILRQKETYYDGRVGSPEVVDFDLGDGDTVITRIKHCEETLKSLKELNDSSRPGTEKVEAKKAESTVCPMDSASNITPKPLNPVKPVLDVNQYLIDKEEQSQLSTQLAELRTDIFNMKLRETQRIGDYTKIEYDDDLEQAFKGSGVVIKEGQFFVNPVAHTSASELVPRMTIDDRLNFLIRLHTAIFKIVENTSDYPKPGILRVMKSATEGKLPDDHPSFDLLQIVLTDTIDWNHSLIKANNFMLPVLERGMRFNERILAACLLSLKGEYFARWTSLVKDCILPTDITDTSRWSDSFSFKPSRRITSRRADMAISDRESSKKFYRRRKDSLLV